MPRASPSRTTSRAAAVQRRFLPWRTLAMPIAFRPAGWRLGQTDEARETAAWARWREHERQQGRRVPRRLPTPPSVAHLLEPMAPVSDGEVVEDECTTDELSEVASEFGSDVAVVDTIEPPNADVEDDEEALFVEDESDGAQEIQAGPSQPLVPAPAPAATGTVAHPPLPRRAPPAGPTRDIDYPRWREWPHPDLRALKVPAWSTDPGQRFILINLGDGTQARGREPHACRVCGSRYSRKDHAKRHCAEQHSVDETRFHCHVRDCDRNGRRQGFAGWKRKSDLDEHVQKVHNLAPMRLKHRRR